MKSQAQALVVDSLLTNAIASSNAIIGTYSFHVDKPTKAQLTASTTRYERATVIVRDLQSTSDTEKGEESAKELNRLYDYITVRIYEGASKLDYQPVEEVTKLLETLLSRMGRDRPQGTEKRRADGYCDAAGVRRKIRDSGVS